MILIKEDVTILNSQIITTRIVRGEDPLDQAII